MIPDSATYQMNLLNFSVEKHVRLQSNRFFPFHIPKQIFNKIQIHSNNQYYANFDFRRFALQQI